MAMTNPFGPKLPPICQRVLPSAYDFIYWKRMMNGEDVEPHIDKVIPRERGAEIQAKHDLMQRILAPTK